MPPNPGSRKSSPCVPAPRACRLRVGILVKWPLADAPGWRRAGKVVRRPPRPRAMPWMRGPPAPRASPSARRRSRRRTTGGWCRNGRRYRACGEREVRAACGGRGSMARTFGARAGQRRTGRAGEVDNFRLSPCSVVAHATV
jgi:hypothetical protein